MPTLLLQRYAIIDAIIYQSSWIFPGKIFSGCYEKIEGKLKENFKKISRDLMEIV